MATNLSALKAAINLLADAAVDTAAVVAGGGGTLSAFAALLTYKNLVPDVMALVPQIGDIPDETKSLTPADYVALVEELAKDLSLTGARAAAIANAGIYLLQELVIVALPKVEVLAAAVKAPAP